MNLKQTGATKGRPAGSLPGALQPEAAPAAVAVEEPGQLHQRVSADDKYLGIPTNFLVLGCKIAVITGSSARPQLDFRSFDLSPSSLPRLTALKGRTCRAACCCFIVC